MNVIMHFPFQSKTGFLHSGPREIDLTMVTVRMRGDGGEETQVALTVIATASTWLLIIHVCGFLRFEDNFNQSQLRLE